MGAFYVDQKKKVLPPSTLPSEHKQWGKNTITASGQQFTFPLTTTIGCYVIFANDRDYGCDRIGIVPDSANTFIVWNKNDGAQFVTSDFSWFAICI